MAKKTIGYVELEWTCPNCGSRNQGSVKICGGCGAAQPADVEFHEPIRQELIEDEATLQKAKAGPDIHCAFCGARNPAGAAVCVNCGADLASGAKRETGKVVAAFAARAETTIACPNCGTANPDTALKCTTCGAALQGAQQPVQPAAPAQPAQARRIPVWVFAVLGVVLIGVCALIAFLSRTTDTVGEVTNRQWERSVVIEQFGPVQREAWRDEIPADGKISSCNDKFRYESSEPVEGAEEICGTPYTVDEGSGFGEVVQDCTYRVYEDYCAYEIDDWSALREVTLDGENDAPAWPAAPSDSNQRLGDQAETYRIIFDVDGELLAFDTTDVNLYNQAAIGSQWTLSINALGRIAAAEPSN